MIKKDCLLRLSKVLRTKKYVLDAKMRRGIVGYIKKCFGEVCQNRPVMLNLIQHLSISIDSINIDRLRVKPAMTERLFSMGDREHASCAERTVKNLFPYSTINLFTSKKVAFTLAEVLITLGIIGVVAAITIPSVISNYRKSVAETKLKKFYTSINQAVILSEIDNGDKKYWDDIPNGFETDENGEPILTKSKPKVWYDKYFAPYLKTVKTEVWTEGSGQVLCYFEDGSMAMISRASVTFFLEAKDFKQIGNHDIDRTYSGVKVFSFQFFPNAGVYPQHYNKGVEPYIPKYWDNQTESLKSDCTKESYYKTTCTKLIQLNGWKIPKDYPLRF